MTMIGLVDALLQLVEPIAAVQPAGLPADVDLAASGSQRDRTAAEPFVYDDRPNTVFVFETDDDRRAQAGVSSGAGEDLIRFAVEIVYVADSGLEEAAQRRTRTLSAVIDARRELYMQRVRGVRSGASWDDLRAAVDVDYVRGYHVRGFALRLYGFRFQS